jgi:aerobic-type carbon monoxide dehydrogenase small subunit (CoxS/CutS family)
MPIIKELHINGTARPTEAEPTRSLLSVLRDDLGLTGAKYGCGEGRCGACTVHVDNRAVRSCNMRVEGAAGKSIRTIEGLATGNNLHALQESFLAADALQCGYCTPGMIMSALGLLNENPEPTRDDIVRGMNGNICRCGSYERIIAAIEQAAKTMKGGAK